MVLRLIAVVTLMSALTGRACGDEPPAAEAPAAALVNGNFQASRPDGGPMGWAVPTPGYEARVVEDALAPGGLAAEVRRLSVGAGGTDRAFGNLMQSFDAAALRGKRIVVRAEVRLALAASASAAMVRDSRAQMWVRIDRPNEQQGFFDNMMERPIRGESARGYRTYAISGVVADDAVAVNIGLMAFGAAPARIADVRVEVMDAGLSADRSPAPLSERGLENLVAMARLYGYVRFFHPSDEGERAEWNRLAIDAVEYVERAGDAEELAAALRSFALPVAPTVQVWAGGEGDAPAPIESAGAPRAVAWRHNGVGLSEGAAQVYRSRRETYDVGAPAGGLPPPGTAVVKPLGGGVWCRVPVCLAANADGRTLSGPVDVLVPHDPRPDWWTPSGRDRSTRLAGVVIAWNVFQHFYPYFEVVGTEWGAELARALRSAATDADEAAYLRTLRRMVAALHDGHGSVHGMSIMPPMPAAVALDWAEDGARGLALTITAVGPDVKGVERGDVVVRISGRPTDELYAEAREEISAATEQWARHRFATDPEWTAPGGGDDVAYTVRRGGAELEVRVPRVRGGMSFRPVREPRPANGSEIAPGVVYFDLNGATYEQFAAALPAMEKASGIVFDARGYPDSAGSEMLRHLTDKTLRSAKWNIPEVTRPDREPVGFVMKASGRWTLSPRKPRLGGEGQKIAFVTGGGAISYAESCMGIVEHYGLGAIVGGATAGTNGNVNPFTLPGGYTVSWTGMQVIKHDGDRHHGVGITPTVPAARTVEGIAAGRDEALEAAVRAVSE